MDIYIKRIDEGIIGVCKDRYDAKLFEYDIEKDKFNIDDKEIMKNIYSEKKLKLFLSYEQYKQGKTPSVYNEIAKINNFLEDKKSVTIELFNGTKIKAEAYLNSILDIRSDGNIFIADRYSNKIIEGNSKDVYYCPATELKCLKYSKNILNIQSDSLKSLRTEKIKEIEETEDEEEAL